MLSAAAKRAVGPELRSRAKRCWPAGDDALRLDDQGRILWRPERGVEAPVGQLRPGPSPLAPRLELLLADSLHGQTRGAIGQRLGQWLDAHLAELTMPLRRLQAAELEAPGRGLAFLLVEGLGNVRARAAQPLLKNSARPTVRVSPGSACGSGSGTSIWPRCCRRPRSPCAPGCGASSTGWRP